MRFEDNIIIATLNDISDIFRVSKQAIQKWRLQGMGQRCQVGYGEYDLLCVYNWYDMYKLHVTQKMERIKESVDTIIK